MAANRKKQSASVRFGPAIKALLICLFIGGAGIGYVWEKSQIDSLGRQIKESENKLAELRRQNRLRGDQLAYLKSPAVLEARVKELKLGLIPPTPEMVVTLPDVAPVAAPPRPVAPATGPAMAVTPAAPTRIASSKH